MTEMNQEEPGYSLKTCLYSWDPFLIMSLQWTPMKHRFSKP